MKCAVADCNRGVERAELCWMHYMRKYRTGSTDKKPRWVKEVTEACPEQNIAYIGLTKGKRAIIDLEDLERLSKYSYHANIMSTGRVRAMRNLSGLAIYLHHDVLDLLPWKLTEAYKEVDHINGDPLDNRKCNLRVVSHQENMLNADRCRNRVGICFNKRANLWMAYIDSPYEKRRYLGYRKTQEEAVALLESARNASD